MKPATHPFFAWLALIPFAALSALAMWQHGYWGIWRVFFESSASLQILADFSILCTLVSIWIWQDAQAHGRRALPWILGTFLTGSFAPLLYLLSAKQTTA